MRKLMRKVKWYIKFLFGFIVMLLVPILLGGYLHATVNLFLMAWHWADTGSPSVDTYKPVIATPDAPITLDTLDKQCELTIWTRKGQSTFVKIPADEIINQLKGADSVPNGIHTSYYDIKGLTYNGNPVYAITGFMPEGVK